MNDAAFDSLKEERAELIREIVAAVMIQVVPHVRSELGAEYVTRDELQTKLVDSFTGVINHRFDEIDSAGEQRHGELVRQTELRFALTATREELKGVVASSAENTVRIDALRTTTEDGYRHFESITGGHGEAIDVLKTHVKELEGNTGKSIGAIRADTKSIKENAQKTSGAVIELIEETKKRQKEIDRELENIKDAQDADAKNLRDSREQTAKDIDALQDDMRKQEVRVISVEAEIKPISAVANAFLKLFTTRRGNTVLASFLILFFGSQLVNAYLTYQFIQRIPMLAGG